MFLFLLLIFKSGGYLQIRYNLGSRDHHVGYFDIFVNDGRRHIVRMWRNRANLTLSLDDHMPIKYVPNSTITSYAFFSSYRFII